VLESSTKREREEGEVLIATVLALHHISIIELRWQSRLRRHKEGVGNRVICTARVTPENRAAQGWAPPEFFS
jgi:hypothetical protein